MSTPCTERLLFGAALVLALMGSAGARAEGGPVPNLRYLKGQTHVHSSNSDDSQTSPADVLRWYASRGYDFIVFTDHEHVTTLTQQGDTLAIPGAELTQNSNACDPPPEAGRQCLLHVNALFVGQPAPLEVPWPPRRSLRRLDIYQRALDVTTRMGGLAQLNHPNYEYAADATLIAEMSRRGMLLVEIANQSSEVNNLGDGRHPSTEALWDAALTAGATVWGMATDDAHHYYDAREVRATGRAADTGDRGFIMVHAQKDVASIRGAVERGDFYSSTGVFLQRIAVTPQTLDIEVAKEAAGAHQFTFIGLRGRVLARSEGRRASFPLSVARGGYVRVVISDEMGRRAWVQPVRVP